MTVTGDANDPEVLPVGTRVDVRTGFDDSWAGGFVVAGHDGPGYRIRRRSDDQVLPVTFTRTTVRRERKNSMWWY